MTNAPPFKIVIPARYASVRLPGKPLLNIHNKTMLEHVYRCAKKTHAQQIVIATDDQRIADAAKVFAKDVCMTSKDHPTGTDRIAEVAMHYAWDANDIVVNLQGDEPLMPKALINQVAANLYQNNTASIATLCAPFIEVEDITDPSKVKVVFNRANMALYFSRSIIPFNRQAQAESLHHPVFRHIGLYAYRVNFLQAFAQMDACEIEQLEQLEQLRALWHGYNIHVDKAAELPGQDINTHEDLIAVEKIFAQRRV